MPQRRHFRRLLLVAVVLFFGVIIADALGVFDDRPYSEIPHGDHVHFVPKDRDPDVPVGQFPTTPPGPGERITPQGQIVPAE